MHIRSSVLVLLATAALSACSFDSPTSSTTHLTGPGVDTIPSVVTSTGTAEYSPVGSLFQWNGSTEIAVGDIGNQGNNPQQTDRGIITFNVQALDGDTAQAAVLTAYECDVKGDPFTFLGQVVVDHITPGTPPGQTQYNGSPLASDVGTLTPDQNTGPRNVTVTSSVESDISSGATYSQFRLRFSNEDGNSAGANDYVDFQTGNGVDCASDALVAPTLIVTY